MPARTRRATHGRTLGSAGVSSLPDAEQDACDVVRALAGLAALLRARNVEVDDDVRVLLRLAEDSGLAAGRVLAYLREVRGAGDGVAVSVPPRLGPWRRLMIGSHAGPQSIGPPLEAFAGHPVNTHFSLYPRQAVH